MSALAIVVRAQDGTVTPGVLGFVVVASLGLATFLLIKSMNRRIRRIDVPPAEDSLPQPRKRPSDDQPPTD